MCLKKNSRGRVSLVVKMGLAAKPKFSLYKAKHPSGSVLLRGKVKPHDKAKVRGHTKPRRKVEPLSSVLYDA